MIFTLLTDVVEIPEAASKSWSAESFRSWVEGVCAGRSVAVPASLLLMVDHRELVCISRCRYSW